MRLASGAHESVDTVSWPNGVIHRLLMAIAVVGLTAFSVAHAGDLDRVVEFDIYAQNLESALLQFGDQARVQMSFQSTGALRAMGARVLKGNYTCREALLQLLNGTTLNFVENGKTIDITSTPSPKMTRSATASGATDPPPYTDTAEARASQSATLAEKSKQGAAKPIRSALQEVVVTGTHLRGMPSSSPLIEITRRDIDQSGYTTVGDVIRSLPENFGNGGPEAIIGSTPNASQSPSGGIAPNLFGLGDASTLTLVNGQRLAADSISGASDISLIPVAIIDHIDVLTGGASAIYGSDAVAGVVNIVLIRDFNGAKTTVLGGGTTNGGGTERNFNQLLGRTWSAGGVILDYEFDKVDPIWAAERGFAQTAPSLTTLSPGMTRNSFFLSAHQDIDSASVFATGLYTHRTAQDAYSNGPLYPSESEGVDVHQYATTGGVKVYLPSAWILSAVGDFSEQRTGQLYTLLPGGPTPLISYEGQTRSVELAANGSILTLPSGAVRGAIGTGYRVEAYNVEQGGMTETPGSRRTIKYGYGELNVPLLKPSDTMWRRALMLDVSGRIERYSDFGDASVPKVGLVYAPFSTINIRAMWGKAFQAPSLVEVHFPTDLLYLPLADPLASTGVSNVLETVGGNRNLGPQTARTWTVGIDYRSAAAKGLVASLTYFDVAYRNLIGTIASPATALTDPLNAPFVTRSPSAAYVQSLIDAAATVLNFTNSPLDPANVAALVEGGYVNISSQDVVGAEFSVRYDKAWEIGNVAPFANCALLDLRQKFVSGSPEVELSGQVFEPTKIRARGGISWSKGSLDVTGLVNYTGSEINTYQQGLPHVASWTTVDFNATFKPFRSSAIGDVSLTLSVENAFDRQPPYVQFDEFVPGIHYDSSNANPLGRAIRVSASWVLR